MDVVIRGKNVKVSEPLRSAATEHLAKLDRYANGFARAEVDFSEERNPRIPDNQRCEVLVHVKGHLLKAHASASEPFAALYAVCDKVEHQVKRLKDKRVARVHPRRIRTERVEVAFFEEEEDQEELQPARIVKTKEFMIKPMSAEEALLQMDLLGHDFFLFTSSESGRAAVIYRRNDGNFGLIETAG
ncbi:MAG: putative sigma-54 modulation protein [Actinomycetota bacterium]|jgi:putative sigma-54 modulation protein|nr:putative sigma-54 modulation protein [Actinomycetota bacterium]MDQ1506070.1 putative sigma-54 modulation protein [Actinomycetota bacterium]